MEGLKAAGTPAFETLLGMPATPAALLAVALCVALLVVQVAAAKVPPLLAFVVAAVAAALLLGMRPAAIAGAIGLGIGETLGSLVVIVCLGAAFGKLIADSGAAQRIASTLTSAVPPSAMPLALAATGFVVGIPLYYNVGFVLLVPLAFVLVARTGLPAVPLAIPMLCGLSVAHGFLPPHPSPLALVAQFRADVGTTLVYGLVVAVPTLILAGPLLARTMTGIRGGRSTADIFLAPPMPDDELPGAANSLVTALLPVALLAAAAGVRASGIGGEAGASAAIVAGDPVVILLASFAYAVVSLGLLRGARLATLMKGADQALRDVAPILLVIAGAGAFKQVLVASGVSGLIGEEFARLPIPSLALGWLVALVIRVCLGSATVAGLTAAGIVAPLVQSGAADPNLMVLAVGAGSLMFSHVNDSGFWLFKEYFGLSIGATLRSWTVMETAVGTIGLVLVLLLSAFVG